MDAADMADASVDAFLGASYHASTQGTHDGFRQIKRYFNRTLIPTGGNEETPAPKGKRRSATKCQCSRDLTNE